MSVNYQVAIPSYRRAEVLRKKTLTTLERLGVEDSRIHIFVANEAEYESYRSALGDRWRLIIGHIGKEQQQKFYHNYFQSGTPLLNMDDDIDDLLELTPDNKLRSYQGTMHDLVQLGFGLCEKTGAGMWGLNAVSNGFFMSEEVTVGLRFIIGNFYGNYAGDPAVIGANREISECSADDWLTTIRSFQEYGRVVRIEWLNAKTKMFAKGGMNAQHEEQGIARRDKHNKDIELLGLLFPELVTVKTKADGMRNLRLRSLTEKKIPKALANTLI